MMDTKLRDLLIREVHDLKNKPDSDFCSKWRMEYLEDLLLKDLYEYVYVQKAIKRLQGNQD